MLDRHSLEGLFYHLCEIQFLAIDSHPLVMIAMGFMFSESYNQTTMSESLYCAVNGFLRSCKTCVGGWVDDCTTFYPFLPFPFCTPTQPHIHPHTYARTLQYLDSHDALTPPQPLESCTPASCSSSPAEVCRILLRSAEDRGQRQIKVEKSKEARTEERERGMGQELERDVE